MKFGFSLIMRGSAATPEAFARVAERAEALGLDSLWCSDHIVIPHRTGQAYLGRADGKLPDHWKEGYWDPFTVLGYLSALTKRITLGTSVCILPMRNPIEVAGLIAHLDRLSGGRIVFGVGVGWFKEEFEVLRWPFHERGARCNEGLAICRALWTEERAAFRGRFYEFADVHFNPKPVQRPHPPIWVAGASAGALRRAARHGAGWHPFKPSFAALEAGRAELARCLEQEGRSLEEITICPKGHLTFQEGPPREGQWPLEGRPADIAEGIRRFGELGVGHFVLDYTPETLQHVLDTMERFVQEVRPKV
jgi:probable F420-dependent oxidoreductase